MRKPTKSTGNKPRRLKKTVYLDRDPDVAKAVAEAEKTRVFSYLCIEALRNWLKTNGFLK